LAASKSRDPSGQTTARPDIKGALEEDETPSGCRTRHRTSEERTPARTACEGRWIQIMPSNQSNQRFREKSKSGFTSTDALSLSEYPRLGSPIGLRSRKMESELLQSMYVLYGDNKRTKQLWKHSQPGLLTFLAPHPFNSFNCRSLPATCKRSYPSHNLRGWVRRGNGQCSLRWSVGHQPRQFRQWRCSRRRR